MRKQLILITMMCWSASITLAQSSNFTSKPEYPKQGENVTITFKPGNILSPGDKKLEGVAYLFNEKSQKAQEIVLTKGAGVYTGTIKTDKDTRAVAFAFTSGEKKLNNGNKAYVLMMYDDQQKPVVGAYGSQAMIYQNYGNYLMGIESQPEVALEYAEKEYANYPDSRNTSRATYFQLINSVKKKEGHPVIMKELQDIEAKGNLTELDYQFLSSWYTRIQMKEKGEELKNLVKEKYPEGTWKKNDMMNRLYAEKDPENLEKMYGELTTKYPAKEEAEKSNYDYLQGYIGRMYASDEKKKDLEKFKKYMQALPAESRYSSYNNLAWGMAEKDKDMEFAKELSHQATTWAKNEMLKPTAKKPDLRTTNQWNKDRKNTYSMYADTYAFILYKLGDYKTGMQYAKEAVAIREKKAADYNDRYALLLEKTAPSAQVKKELEEMAKAGHAGKDTKEVLSRIYVKMKGSEAGLDTYMTALNNYGIEKLKAELVKKMINEPAPKFRLVNLEGKDVDLAQLKGKVVVVDFWATWCGPCVASFPGMQKAQNKYESDPNVAFLFIDTWEGGDNQEKRQKDVKGFIEKNKYTFNVLYDTPEKEDPNTFVVVSNYKVNGIPTKFVIDQDGQIRFKSVGYSGNEDGLVQELSLMIEMAGSPTYSGSGSGKKAF